MIKEHSPGGGLQEFCKSHAFPDVTGKDNQAQGHLTSEKQNRIEGMSLSECAWQADS